VASADFEAFELELEQIESLFEEAVIRMELGLTKASSSFQFQDLTEAHRCLRKRLVLSEAVFEVLFECKVHPPTLPSIFLNLNQYEEHVDFRQESVRQSRKVRARG